MTTFNFQRPVRPDLAGYLKKIGVPEHEISPILAIADKQPSGSLLLSAICALVIVLLIALVLINLEALRDYWQSYRVMERPYVFYTDSWLSIVPLCPTIVAGTVYLMLVLVRQFPQFEERATVENFLMVADPVNPQMVRLNSYIVRAVLRQKTNGKSFLQRGNDCSRKIVLLLFLCLIAITLYSLRNDINCYELVTEDGLEYGLWGQALVHKVPLNKIQKIKFSCDHGQHGSKDVNVELEANNDIVKLSHAYWPSYAFEGNKDYQGEALISQTVFFTRLLNLKRLAIREKVTIEKSELTECIESINQGIKDLPELYGPIQEILN